MPFVGKVIDYVKCQAAGNTIVFLYLIPFLVAATYVFYCLALIVGGYALYHMPQAKLRFDILLYYCGYIVFPVLALRIKRPSHAQGQNLADGDPLRDVYCLLKGRPALLLGGIVVVCLHFLMSGSLITMMAERARYHFDLSHPHFFYDPSLPHIFGDLLVPFVPADMISAAIEASATMVLWFVCLSLVKRAYWGAGVLVFGACVLSNTVWQGTTQGNYEWACSVLGAVGVFYALRGRYGLAATWIALACGIRFTGLFFGVAAAILLIADLARGKIRFSEIPFGPILLSLAFVAYNLSAIFYYIFFVRSGPGYLLPQSSPLTINQTAASFLGELWTGAPVLLVGLAISLLGQAGAFQKRWLWLALASLLLLVLRSMSGLADGVHYYTFFVPIFTMTVVAGFDDLAERCGNTRARQLVPLLCLAGFLATFYASAEGWLQHPWNRYMHPFMATFSRLDALDPPPVAILQNDFTVRPYIKALTRHGTKIEFLVNDNLEAAKAQVTALSRQGCVVMVARDSALILSAETWTLLGFQPLFKDLPLPRLRILSNCPQNNDQS